MGTKILALVKNTPPPQSNTGLGLDLGLGHLGRARLGVGETPWDVASEATDLNSYIWLGLKLSYLLIQSRRISFGFLGGRWVGVFFTSTKLFSVGASIVREKTILS